MRNVTVSIEGSCAHAAARTEPGPHTRYRGCTSSEVAAIANSTPRRSSSTRPSRGPRTCGLRAAATCGSTAGQPAAGGLRGDRGMRRTFVPRSGTSEGYRPRREPPTRANGPSVTDHPSPSGTTSTVQAHGARSASQTPRPSPRSSLSQRRLVAARRRAGKPDREPGSAAGPLVQRHRAGVQVDEPSHQRQPDPRPR